MINNDAILANQQAAQAQATAIQNQQFQNTLSQQQSEVSP